MPKSTKSIQKKTKKNKVLTRIPEKASRQDVKPRYGLLRRHELPKKVRLPGYLRFTRLTLETLWQYRIIFFRLAGLSWLIMIMLFVVSQQSQYTDIRDAVKDVSSGAGGITKVALSTGVLLVEAGSGSINSTFSETQQLYQGVIYVFLWLITIWLLRFLMAGNKIRVRDGIYSAGAPIVTTMLIGLFGLLQLIPAAIGSTLYGAVVSSGVVNAGLQLLFGILAILLLVVSLYWITGTAMALVVATLPGAYPVASIKTGNKLVLGQRAQIVGRMLWLVGVVVLFGACLLLPAVLIDGVIHVAWLPLVPLTLQLIVVSSLIYSSTYLYLLYREIVNERAE
jgi:hypothetical protein